MPEREKRIFQRLPRLNGGPLRPQHVRTIYREIISSCLALEQPLRDRLPRPGRHLLPAGGGEQFGSGAELLPFGSIDAVFDEVERGRAEYGVVPVENSTEGVVAQTLDRFIASPLTIKAEVLLRIDHCLLAASTPSRGGCAASSRIRSRWRSAAAGSRSTSRACRSRRWRATPSPPRTAARARGHRGDRRPAAPPSATA